MNMSLVRKMNRNSHDSFEQAYDSTEKKRIKERKIHMKVMKLLRAKSNALMKESLIKKIQLCFCAKDEFEYESRFAKGQS